MSYNAIDTIGRSLMYQEFARRIRLLIEDQNLWGKLLAPERELAEAFGVSRDTVRKGLEALESEGLISRRQGLGTMVRARLAAEPGKAVGHVLVGSAGGGSPDFISGIAEVAGAQQWLAAFGNLLTASGRSEFAARLSAGGIDGLILLSVTDVRTVREMAKTWSGPTVIVDHHFPELPASGVMEDCAGGIRQAVEHLVALGHRRIGYVEPSRRELNPWKFQGYAAALAAAGIALDERLVAQSPPQFGPGQDAGEKLLTLADPPTAIVACHDRIAWGVWRAAELAGRQVGRDLALVGYGDDSAVSGLGQELSSVSFDPAELGRTAMRTIVDLRAARTKPGGVSLVPTKLVVRESSKNARRMT